MSRCPLNTYINVGVVYKDEEIDRVDRLTTKVGTDTCVIYHNVFYKLLGAEPWSMHIDLHKPVRTNVS